jgi:hypothetical protein
MGDKDRNKPQGHFYAGKEYQKRDAYDDLGEYHREERNYLHIVTQFKTVPVNAYSPQGTDDCRSACRCNGNKDAVQKSPPEVAGRKKPPVRIKGKRSKLHAGIAERREDQNEQGEKQKGNGKNERKLRQRKIALDRPSCMAGRFALGYTAFENRKNILADVF